MTTIKKVSVYERRTNPTGNPVLDNRKIKLVFTDGTVRTFYEGIDKAYKTIVWLAFIKLLASVDNYTSEQHKLIVRPYTKYIIESEVK